MKKRGLAVAILLVSGVLFSSCVGFNFEGDFTVTYVGDPNPAWVTIEVPTGGPTHTTTDNQLYLSGSAFVSDAYLHGPPWDSGVAVSWANEGTGDAGPCVYYTDVLFPFVETKWYVSVPLSFGSNPITITAYEYLAPAPGGYRRSETLTVTRI